MDPLTVAMGLAQFAPQIIRWISGNEKAGDAAERIVSIATEVTGEPSGVDAFKKMKVDPALAMEFRRAVMANETELDKLYLGDRQNARNRDVELAKAGYRNKRADIMVAMAAVGTIGGLVAMLLLGYLKAKHPDAIGEGVFGALLAQLATITSFFGLCLRDAFQFEFGSSRGSRDKDEIIARSPAKDGA